MAAIYLALRVIDQRTAPLHAMARHAGRGPDRLAAVDCRRRPLADVRRHRGDRRRRVARAALPQRAVAAGAGGAGARVAVAPRSRLIPIVAFVFQRVTLAGLAVNLAAIPAWRSCRSRR